MKRKTIASLLITSLTISMLVSGCGNKQNDTEQNSEVVSGTETEKVSEIDSEKDTQVSTNDSETEVSESEKVDENKNEDGNKEEEQKPAHTCDFTALKNDANNHWHVCSCGNAVNVSAHEYTDEYDADCNVCGYKRNVPEKPVHTCDFNTLKTDANNHWYACSCGNTSSKGAHGYDDEYDASCNTCGYTRNVPEKPVEPSKPGSSVNWNGGNITLERLPISIPTMTDFNKTGLESSGNDWWWTGSENDKQALSAMNQIYKTCEDFFNAMVSLGTGSQGTNAFSVTQNAIWFSYTDGMKQEFCLTRDANKGYYILTINRSLKEDIFYNGADISDTNRDVVRTLCSFVSSKPETLFNGIYEDLHGTAFISDSGWTIIGDCKVQFDDTSSSGHIRYFIKAK